MKPCQNIRAGRSSARFGGGRAQTIQIDESGRSKGTSQSRCKVEMNGVPSAVKMLELRSLEGGSAKHEAPRERLSKERAAEIMAQAGFSVKKFGEG